MAEGFEALFSMIGAHAARPHAAEAHTGSGKMDDGIVDAAAAEGKTARNPICRLPAVCKQVQRKRFGPVRHEPLHLADIPERHYRQHRPENFLLHHRRIRAYIL